MQMKDKRHPLRVKGYLILYMGGADRFITSTSDLALITYHWRLITCRTLISLRLSVMNPPPPMKAFLRVKSSTRWLTKAVDTRVISLVSLLSQPQSKIDAPSASSTVWLTKAVDIAIS